MKFHLLSEKLVNNSESPLGTLMELEEQKKTFQMTKEELELKNEQLMKDLMEHLDLDE